MLTLRQRAIVDQVREKVEVVADVGCDHGYVGCEILRQGKADKVVFSDISAKSLDKARILCDKYAITNCEFVCCDGLNGIKCDLAIIGGMGGLEIISILKNAHELPDFLILQPMKNVEELRVFLQKRYSFEKDFIIFDKKFYNILVLVKGVDCLSHDEILFGRTNLKEKSEDFWLIYARKYPSTMQFYKKHRIQLFSIE